MKGNGIFAVVVFVVFFQHCENVHYCVCVLVSRHITQIGRIGYQSRSKLYADILCVFRAYFITVPSSFVCLILIFTSHQQSFNYIGTSWVERG